MRGALACLIAAAALGGVCMVSVSGAATERYAVARATIAVSGAESFGAAESRDAGAQRVDTAVDERDVSIAGGRAIARAEGENGSASVLAQGVEVLGGRVSARRVRRSATGTSTEGLVAGLEIDGTTLGSTSSRQSYALSGGGRVVVNDGGTGLRVVTDDADVRVAVVGVRTATRKVEPTPTATPAPTRTPKPKASPKPTRTAKPGKRRKPPEVPKRLSAGGYAFPVYSDDVTYEDTFGAARAAPIGSHEGTDVFAPFGSPVVAVRDGRLTKVGTLPISGNRLWLVDEDGDAFFYAHLSSFSTIARNGARVEAGDVLGFVGNTGDAEPTPPHVHFEVHPGGIEEDPVNPYPILTAWEARYDVPPGAWLQQLGSEAADRPGALVTVRDFIAE